MDVLDILKTHAGLYPGKLAYGYIGKEGELTEQFLYSELYQHVLAASRQLAERFPVSSRALILLPAEASFICSFLGSLHAGIIAVPTPISYSEPGINRILNIIRDCSAAGIITNKKTYKMLFQRQNAASGALQEYDMEWFFTDDFNSNAGNTVRRHNVHIDTAYLQYTSGSTSQPKGVMISHANLTANLSAINNCFGRTADSVSVTWLPHYHDMGLVDGLLSPLFTGGTGFIISPLLFITKPVLLLQTISTYRAGFCGGPGFGLDHCLARVPEEQLQALDLSSLQVLYVGAEPIRISSLERFAAATKVCGFKKESLVPAYGLAEATLAVSLHLYGTATTYGKTTGPNPKEVVACGPPVELTEVVIVDPRHFNRLGDGDEGEIWVRNAAIASGYWERPEISDATFRAYTSNGDGPFLRTGDLGFLDHGLLFITGRTKELIIIRGVNYYPQDIEEVAAESHLDIQPNATAAFAVDTTQGEALMIVSEVRRVTQTADDEKSIKTQMAQRVGLAFGLIPYEIILIAPGKLPKTSSGKIQRLKARELFAKTIQ